MYTGLKLNTTEVTEVTKENINGLLINFNFRDGENSPLPITKPSDIEVKLTLQRAGGKKIQMFDLNMTEIIAAFISQTPQLRVVSSDYTFGAINRLPIRFTNLNLVGADKLIVETSIKSTASAGATVANSEVFFETLAGMGDDGVIPMIQVENFATGDTKKSFDNFAPNTTKVVLITDPKLFNHASTKTLDEVEIITAGKQVTKRDTLISYENDVRNEGENRSFHEVLYWANQPLINAKFDVKLKAPATQDTKLVSVSFVRA